MGSKDAQLGQRLHPSYTTGNCSFAQLKQQRRHRIPATQSSRRHAHASAALCCILATAAVVMCGAAVPATAQQTEQTFISNTEHFPGWKGTLPNVRKGEASGDPNKARMLRHGSLGEVEWSGEVVQLAWSPRLYLYRNFLSDAECDHLIKKAQPTLEKSEVVDNDTGGSKSDEVRTSSGAFFGVREDEVIARIEERIARISFLPVDNGEGMQVLRYQIGEQYRPHHDFFWDDVNKDPAHGGQRIATMLMYLSTPEEGGETVFPRAEPKSTGPEWSACAQEGLSVKSRKGDAVFFYALQPNGTTDLASEHGSCPTLKGTKWSATKWIHVSSLVDGAAAVGIDDATACRDDHKRCEDWAFADECKNNPNYMLKSCRKSCEVCEPNVSGGQTAGVGNALSSDPADKAVEPEYEPQVAEDADGQPEGGQAEEEGIDNQRSDATAR